MASDLPSRGRVRLSPPPDQEEGPAYAGTDLIAEQLTQDERDRAARRQQIWSQFRQEPVDDRRDEPAPNLDAARLLDPTPLQKSIYPNYIDREKYPQGAYWPQDNRLLDRAPTKLEQAAGADDLDKMWEQNLIKRVKQILGH